MPGTTEYQRVIAPIEQRMMALIWGIVHDAHDANDAFQETLHRIVKQWNRILQHPNPQALVLLICTQAAYDCLRLRARDISLVQSLKQLGARHPEQAVGWEIEEREMAELVRVAITELSEQQALVVMMRLCDGADYALIASAANCDETTARTHYSRGRRKLAELLLEIIPTEKESK